MCTGMEAALIAAAATAVSAASSIQQGKASARQAAFQAAVARQQAERQEKMAALEERRVRRAASQKQGRQRALFAASGIDPSKGTALMLAEDSAGEGELLALLTRSDGLNRAYQLRQGADLDLMRGRAAQQQGYFQAGTTLLRNARSFAGR